jgi:hypothetical protein
MHIIITSAKYDNQIALEIPLMNLEAAKEALCYAFQ